MKPAKKMDIEIADELGLRLADIPMIVKHVHKLHAGITGFVFAYIKNDVIYYDTAEVLKEANGRRIRINKFSVTKDTLTNLDKRLYQRWYGVYRGMLHPLQLIKPNELHDHFYFVIDDNPLRHTKAVMNIETQFIRKKPLMACRKEVVGWGEPVARNRKEVLETA